MPPLNRFTGSRGAVAETELLEHVDHAPFEGVAAQAVRLAPVRQVLLRAEIVVERELLRDDPELLPRGQSVEHHVVTEHAHAPAGRLQQPRDAANRGGLAGAVWPEQTKDLAGRHGERHTVDGDEIAVGLSEFRDVDHDLNRTVLPRPPTPHRAGVWLS